MLRALHSNFGLMYPILDHSRGGLRLRAVLWRTLKLFDSRVAEHFVKAIGG